MGILVELVPDFQIVWAAGKVPQVYANLRYGKGGSVLRSARHGGSGQAGWLASRERPLSSHLMLPKLDWFDTIVDADGWYVLADELIFTVPAVRVKVC